MLTSASMDLIRTEVLTQPGQRTISTPTGTTRDVSRGSSRRGSRPSTGGELPSLMPAWAAPGSTSPFEEERKMQQLVKTLRKRVRELESEGARLENELREARVAKKGNSIDPNQRRKQMESAYGMVLPGLDDNPVRGHGPLERLAGLPPSNAPPTAPMDDASVFDSRLAEAHDEWEARLAALQRECEERVHAGDREKQDALGAIERMKIELGTLNTALEESASRSAKREKQASVELLRRRSLRRMMNAGLASGWGAWFELWNAKTYAMRRLREAANRLRRGDVSKAFYEWRRIQENGKLATALKTKGTKRQSLRKRLDEAQREAKEADAARRELSERVRELSTLLADREATLASQADELTRERRYAEGKLELLRVAQRDETKGLVERVRELTAAAKASEAEMIQLRSELPSGDMKEEARRAWEAAEAAERRAVEADEKAYKQVASNKSLLESLLEKQRRQLEEQMAGCTCAHAARREAELQAQYEKEKLDRVEMMGRQSVRRFEFWSAKVEATTRLRKAANRFRAPEIAHAFGHWEKRVQASRRARLQTEVESKLSLLTEEGRRAANLEGELKRVRAALADASKERRALAERVASLDGGLALESLRLEEVEAREKMERVELLRRQVGRRMMNAGLANGWAAWHELWSAKTYAMGRLQQAASRFKAPELARSFQWWLTWRQSKAHKGEMKAVRAREAAALEDREEIVTAMERMREDYEAQLIELHQQKAEMRATLATMDGGASQLQAMLDEQAAEEKERRVEIYKRQVARRILQQGLARGFTAWLVMAQARAYAYARLKKVGRRLRGGPLAEAFEGWAAVWEAIREHKGKQALASKLKKEAGLKGDAISHSEALERKVAEYERRLVAAERDKAIALERQLVELTGSTEDVLRMHEERAKEERVELMRRQAARRMLSAGLARGFGAWLEFAGAKAYAMKRLRECGNRLKSPESALQWEAFTFWVTQAARARAQQERKAFMRKEAGLAADSEGLAQQLKRTIASYERQLEAAELEKYKALEAQEVELTGSVEDVMAMRAEREKEERIELLRRQAVRRMRNARVSGAWQCWLDLWEAKMYAMGRLQQAASRLKAPEVAEAFHWWVRLIEMEHERTEVKKLHQREKQLKTGVSAAEAAVQRAREEGARQVAAVREEMRIALERQLVELTGTTEEVLAMRRAQEKDERIEMLRRQSLRRMLHAGIAYGFLAWLELADARRYAIGRLREVGNKLRAPEKSKSFSWWAELVVIQKRAAELAKLEAETKSVEARLRRAKHENHKLEMVRASQDDEIRALRQKIEELSGAMTASANGAVNMQDLSTQLEAAKARWAEAAAEAVDAEMRRVEAEDANEKQRVDSQRLIEKLLAEQREKLEGSSHRIQKQARDAELAQRQALQAEIDRYRDEAKASKGALREEKKDGVARERELHAQLEKQRAEASVEKMGLQEEMAHLKLQLSALQAAKPPPVVIKDEPVPKQKGSALLKVDLDESPDADPVSVQLAAALRKNATRVLDLFRSWDTDGDGTVTRKEFHTAMERLGLEVPRKEIDGLFSEWDKDGGGEISFAELKKILSARASPPKVESAASAVKAVAKLKMLGKK